MNPQEKLTTEGNFKLYEIGKSSTADRLDIDNTPPLVVVNRAKILAQFIFEPVRAEFGAFGPQSWYRCELLEKALTWDSGFKSWAAKRGRDWVASKAITPIATEMAWKDYFAKKSHPKGEAGDIEVNGTPNDELFHWIRQNLEFDQLIREFPKPDQPMSGWVHVSRRASGNRKEVFSIPWRDECHFSS